MQVINDTEVFEPNECYFAVEPDPEDINEVMVYITSKEYYDENQCLDDCFADHSLPENIVEKLEDNDISNLMEATWGSSLSLDEVRKVMTNIGFIENKDMLKFQ